MILSHVYGITYRTVKSAVLVLTALTLVRILQTSLLNTSRLRYCNAWCVKPFTLQFSYLLKVGSFDGLAFVMILIFILFGGAFIGFVIFWNVHYKKRLGGKSPSDL